MSRMYTFQFSRAHTAAGTLWQIIPGTEKPVLLHACFLSQNTEVGDAAEEMINVEITRDNSVDASGGGSAPAAVPLDSNDAADSATIAEGSTTDASGTPVILHSESFNVRVGWAYIPTPEMRPRADLADQNLVLQLVTAPADSITFDCTVYFEEL